MFFTKSSFTWIGLFLFLPFLIFSQNNDRCHSDQKTDALIQQDPVYKKALNTDQIVSSFPQKSSQTIVTIPVHVIITHPPGQAIGTGVNFTEEHILSQIDVLNLDFRRLNDDAGNTPPVFPAADSEIEFCLAIIDPDGNPTNGITRFGTNQNLSDNETAIKAATGWDRDTYLNIWVGDGLGGILGWAYLPSTTGLPNATLDGIVVASCTFGGPGFGTCSPYNLGRTATHEVGHYLGLRHVWGNGGCNNDDNIGDTPIQSSSNFGCPNHPSPSCNNGGDMFMNYMDYVDDDCMNAFTVGQNTRMHNILNTSRSSLLSAAATVCNDQVAPLVLTLIDQTDITCNGDDDGSITVEATGGTGNYTFTINGGSPQSNNTFTNLAPANYTIEVDDGSNTISIDVVIIEPAILVGGVDSQVDIDCAGNNNGLLIITATGGTNTSGNGYLYNFNGNGFSPNNIFTNLSGGTFTIEIQDENFCTTSITATINEPEPITSFIDEQIDIDCAGSNSGQVTISSIGGSSTYLYSLNGGNFTPINIFSNLGVGNYTLQTIDLDGCSHLLSFDLTEPPILQLSIAEQTDLTCYGDQNGFIELTAQGGLPNYQYAIDNSNYQNSPIFSSLSGGNHVVNVLDANGCIQAMSININEPNELVGAVSSQTNVNCFGENTGAITIDVFGGTGTPSIQMNGSTVNGNSATFENLSAGTYTYEITDENNCDFLATLEILEYDEVDLTVQITQDVSCIGENNGLIEVQALGGSGNFTYLLNGVEQNSNTFTNLSSGTYTIETIDNLGCSDLVTVDILEPTPMEINISQQTNLNCYGENNGSVSISANGGNGNLQYTLGNETNGTGTFNNLSAGVYSINISDANNCTQSIDVEITAPAELSVSETNNIAVDCFGNNSGSLQISATGGASNYQFSIGTETNTSGEFNNLVAGNYTISVTDGNNCQSIIQSTITQPTELVASISTQQNVNCFGENSGTVNLIANGGNGNITFTLNGETNSSGIFSNLSSGNYSAIVQDQNSCQTTLPITIEEPSELNLIVDNLANANCAGEVGSVQLSANGGSGNYQFTLGSTTNSTGFFEGLNSGVYSIQVSDNNMCTEMIDIEITEPIILNAAVSQIQNINCFGGNEGNLQVDATGGSGSLTFTLGNETNSTGFFQNLTAGNYNVMVEDENNCTYTLSVEITQPSALVANITNQQNVSCFGENTGSITIEANGGNGNNTFTLNGATNSTGSFSNLSSGTYSILVADQNNCETTIDVIIIQPTELDLEIQNITEASCAGQEGSVQLSASGGTGNYQFTLGNNVNSTGFFEGLSGGIYQTEVIDNNGCISTLNVEILEPTSLNVSISNIQNINCFGENSGSVQISGTGGIGNLTYALGNETNTSGLFENLSAGNYDIIIEDENNCNSIVSIEITQPAELIANISNLQNINCFGETTGSISVEAIGGNGNNTFTLNGTSNSNGNFSNLSGGTYSILVTDQNNCETTIDIILDEPAELNLEIQNITEASCEGQEGSVQLIASGGNGNYQFTLENTSNTTGFFEGLGGGIYPTEVIDNNGCISTLNVEIIEPTSLSASISDIQNINCFGENSGSIQVNGTGGVGNLTFNLGNETNTTGLFENLSAGNYEIIIEDENNCNSNLSVEIIQPNELILTTSQVIDVNCNSGNDGLVNLASTGGSGQVEFTLNGQTNTNGVFENLTEGNYNFIATDANGCTDEIQIIISSPTEIIAQIDQTQNVSCAGMSDGNIQLSASGGVGNFVFSLGNQTNSTGLFEGVAAGVYPIQIVDANNCLVEVMVEITEPQVISFSNIQSQSLDCHGDSNGSIEVQSIGGTGNLIYSIGNETNANGIFENLSAGLYQLVTTDENNCTATTEVEIIEPAPIEVIFENQVDNSCYGESNGFVDLSAIGGTGIVQFTLGAETNTTGLFENLPSGFYQVQLEDENNCISTANITISQPEPIVPNSEIVSTINCFGEIGGVVQITAGGGNGNFTYTNNNNTNTTGLFENLSAGNYEFQVVDGNGCDALINITIDQPQEIQLVIVNSTTTGCNGNATGTAQVSASAGIGIITYEMNGETNTTGLFENLAAGVYSAIATDENGCTSNLNIPISEENDIQFESSNLINVSCFGNNNGGIFINAVSSSGDLTYELNGITNSTGSFEDLFAGNYNVTIIDANGCSMIIPFEVMEPEELILNLDYSENANCFGTATGTVNLMAAGGSTIFTYEMNSEENDTGIFENLPAGVYNAQVSDSYGCVTLLEVEITEPNELLISAIEIENDFGNSEGSVTLIGEGGTAPFTYSLDGSNYQNGNTFDNLPAGEYEGFIQDVNGCISQTTFTIEIETGIINPNLGVTNMEIIPNPFSEFLFLNIELEFSQKIKLDMFTILGQEVYQSTLQLPNGKNQINLEPSQNLPAGSYILRVQNDKNTIGYFKLIKQK